MFNTDKLSTFQPSNLNHQQQILLEQQTKEIKHLIQVTAQNIIEIGDKLHEVKELLGHGHFGKWLKTEFNWSVAKATKMMQASHYFKNVNFTNLNFAPSAIYLLAAPSTPESARTEALSRAETGEQISYSLAKELVNRHKNSNELSSNSKAVIDIVDIQEEKPQGDKKEFVSTNLTETSSNLSSINTLQPISFAQQLHDLNPLVDIESFNQSLAREWLRMAREKQFFSLLLCGIDNLLFKKPELYHSTEKTCIDKITQVICLFLKRPADLVTYYGQGIFAILLPSTTLDGSIQVAEKIRNEVIVEQIKITNSYTKIKQLVTVNLAICSLIPSQTIYLESILTRLTETITTSQQKGGNCVVSLDIE